MKRKPKKLVPSELDSTSLRTILDSMVEAVLVVDDSGRIALTNRALDELLDRDARGSRPKKLIRSEQLRMAVRRARRERVATEVEIEGIIGERTLMFQAQVSPLPGPGGVVVVLHDVSALKDADRVRRDFVANAAHELRTPLTAIRGFAETLANGALAEPKVAQSFLAGILRQVERLQRLTDDLALLSRAESPELAYEAAPTSVSAVCRETVASVSKLARDKGVLLEVELPKKAVVVPISARALEEVLTNLLENAIKYSKPRAHVVLALRENDGSIELDVRDEGIGIPARYHARIFERFFRVDEGRSREEGGSGLGLSIVRHLVNRMGGTISVKSAVGKGSRFRITLPAGASSRRARDQR